MQEKKRLPNEQSTGEKKAVGSSFDIVSPMATKLPAPSPGTSLTTYICYRLVSITVQIQNAMK